MKKIKKAATVPVDFREIEDYVKYMAGGRGLAAQKQGF